MSDKILVFCNEYCICCDGYPERINGCPLCDNYKFFTGTFEVDHIEDFMIDFYEESIAESNWARMTEVDKRKYLDAELYNYFNT